MKLSSTPTRWALTSVIAAAMKYGPTKIPRIAYELDMPVETCRYYVKKFYSMGFRFLPVVDYFAIGLRPHVVFLRLGKRVRNASATNLLRWLDSVYVVYRAALNTERDYLMQVVLPEREGGLYHEMLGILREADVLENYDVDEVVDGYYKPEWMRMYDFTYGQWGEEIDIEIPEIPLSRNKQTIKFDKIDLLIIEELEIETTTKMKQISSRHNISPQLVSYHREKHVEGGRMITGFVPVRRTRQEDVQYVLVKKQKESTVESSLIRYVHGQWMTKDETLVRIHKPIKQDLSPHQPAYTINPYDVISFSIPTEHMVAGRWTSISVFIEKLEKLIGEVSV
ncbi:MAG: hypothetical protein NZ941_01910 [Candidatus Caldarchaeum sp.]|nr:hypothetical protein [Candidatus Caldarchaeum sp.]